MGETRRNEGETRRNEGETRRNEAKRGETRAKRGDTRRHEATLFPPAAARAAANAARASPASPEPAEPAQPAQPAALRISADLPSGFAWFWVRFAVRFCFDFFGEVCGSLRNSADLLRISGLSADLFGVWAEIC